MAVPRRITKLFFGAKKRPKKRRSSRASSNSPEYQALFRSTSKATPVDTKESLSSTQGASIQSITPDLNPESPKRSNFADQAHSHNTSTQPESTAEQTTAEPTFAKFNDKALEGLRLALLRSLDESLSHSQQLTVVKIIDGLSPNRAGSTKEKISALLPLIEQELGRRQSNPKEETVSFNTSAAVPNQRSSVGF